MNTNSAKSYLFFDSKQKRTKKPPQQPQINHSRSLSAKSDLTKNSARNKLTSQKQLCLPLTKKQKQIREAIQYRYKKSKMREYEIDYGVEKDKDYRNRKNISRSRSNQMAEFKDMKALKVVNLKEFHENIAKKKLQEKERNSARNVLKIRTNSGITMKTEGSERSGQRLKFLKSYLEPRTPTKLQSKLKAGTGVSKNKEEWKFISIQIKQKSKKNERDSKSKSREIKINSHRTLTIEKNEKNRMKTTQSEWGFMSKLKDLGKLSKKYRF